MLMQPKCHHPEVDRICLCMKRNYLFCVRCWWFWLSAIFDLHLHCRNFAMQYKHNTMQCNFRFGAISLRIPSSVGQNFQMIHVEFHLFLKVQPTFTFRVKTGEKSAYLVCLAKRLTRTQSVCVCGNQASFLGKIFAYFSQSEKSP